MRFKVGNKKAGSSVQGDDLYNVLLTNLQTLVFFLYVFSLHTHFADCSSCTVCTGKVNRLPCFHAFKNISFKNISFVVLMCVTSHHLSTKENILKHKKSFSVFLVGHHVSKSRFLIWLDTMGLFPACP